MSKVKFYRIIICEDFAPLTPTLSPRQRVEREAEGIPENDRDGTPIRNFMNDIKIVLQLLQPLLALAQAFG
jgi:hypothetical protein